MRAFPVVIAAHVNTSAAFYEALGFERHFQLPETGEPGVYVEDVDETVARLGARVLRPPQDMPWGERVAYVLDPDGNPVALAQ